MDEITARGIMKQLLEAAAFCHELGVVRPGSSSSSSALVYTFSFFFRVHSALCLGCRLAKLAEKLRKGGHFISRLPYGLSSDATQSPDSYGVAGMVRQI